MAQKKPWYKSTTVIFNVLTLVGALGSIPFTGVVGPAVAAKILAASSVANILLRVLKTKHPIGKPEPAE